MNYTTNTRGESVPAVGAPGSLARLKVEQPDREANVNRFMELYPDYLKQALTKYPDQYGYGVDKADIVCARMREAFLRGTYNHDSHAIRWTCKALGIKPTRTALEGYFNAQA